VRTDEASGQMTLVVDVATAVRAQVARTGEPVGNWDSAAARIHR